MTLNLSVSCAVAILITFQVGYPTIVASKVRDLSVVEFEALEKSQGKTIVAVHFDRAEARKADPKFLKKYAAASDVLDSFNIELAKVNCETVAISHCSSASPDLYIVLYRDGAEQKKLPLDTLYDKDSITAHLLQASLDQEVRYIDDTSVYNELITEVRGKKDLVICFTYAFGTKGHRYFLETAYVYSEQFVFALTTDQKVAKTLGLPEEPQDFAVSLFHCKDHHTQNQDCPATSYKGEAKSVPLAWFLQTRKLPRIVFLGSDEKTEYDSASVPVNKIYVFTDEDEKLDVSQLEQFSEEMQGAIGIIIVNVLQHKNILSEFGFSEKTSFPTAALVPAVNKGKEERFVEQYPEEVSPFSVENLKKFVLPFVTDPDNEYERLAFSSALYSLQFSEYVDSMKSALENNYVLSTSFSVVAFCRPDYEPCKKFHPMYRRLVRSLSRSGHAAQSIGVFYVDTTVLPDDNKHHNLEVEPVIRIFSRSMKYRAYSGEVTYEGLLVFVMNRTQIDVTPLPLSVSDLIPIELRAQEAEEGDYTSDMDPGPMPKEEIEDDEVAAGVLLEGFQPPPADVVPSLTDKTFDSTKQAHDLLVVHFLQPWDVRCRAFTKLYTDAAVSLGSVDVGEFSIKLAQVNCFDWTDVCTNKNITLYPTIKMYRGSKELNYRGPLDSENLVKAVLLLHASSPVSLKSQEEAEMFLSGKFPKTSVEATDLSVLGMFSRTTGNEFEVFTSAAATLEGKFLLGYVSGDIAQKLYLNGDAVEIYFPQVLAYPELVAAFTPSSHVRSIDQLEFMVELPTPSHSAQDYGLSLPTVLISKRRDALRPLAVFNKGFTSQNLEQFIQLSSLPVFGELTVMNLPLYHQHSKPLVIVFRQSDAETVISPVIAQIAKQSGGASVFFCTMKVEEGSVNAEILQSYIGESKVPTLIMVDHSKGAVYQFQTEVSKSAVSSWITRCISDEEKPTNVLKEGRWKPLLEGYNFLEMIDQEEAEKKRKKNVDEDEDGFIQAAGSDENEDHEDYDRRVQQENKNKRGRLGKPTSQSHDEL